MSPPFNWRTNWLFAESNDRRLVGQGCRCAGVRLDRATAHDYSTIPLNMLRRPPRATQLACLALTSATQPGSGISTQSIDPETHGSVPTSGQSATRLRNCSWQNSSPPDPGRGLNRGSSALAGTLTPRISSVATRRAREAARFWKVPVTLCVFILDLLQYKLKFETLVDGCQATKPPLSGCGYAEEMLPQATAPVRCLGYGRVQKRKAESAIESSGSFSFPCFVSSVTSRIQLPVGFVL